MKIVLILLALCSLGVAQRRKGVTLDVLTDDTTYENMVSLLKNRKSALQLLECLGDMGIEKGVYCPPALSRGRDMAERIVLSGLPNCSPELKCTGDEQRIIEDFIKALQKDRGLHQIYVRRLGDFYT